MRLYKILWCLLCSSSIIIAHHDSIITNVSQNDGFGSQFHNIIATVIFAEINKKQYVYTPFQKMDHNYNSETNFIAKKEWLINFMQNFKIRTGSKVISQRNCKQFLDKNIGFTPF